VFTEPRFEPFPALPVQSGSILVQMLVYQLIQNHLVRSEQPAYRLTDSLVHNSKDAPNR
jgi:hypothetical protein